jgi:hypothetical protein
MSVNNFDRIRNMLEFPDRDSFYFLQVLKRRKDNPDLGKDMKHIADYYIYSLDQFDELKPRIIAQCDVENARAYFRINRRDAKKVAMQVLKRTVDYIMSEDYRAVKNAFASCAGEFHSDPDKKWIVDVDWKDIPEGVDQDEYLNILISKVQELVAQTGRDNTVIMMPTKNGIHVICRPFNLQKFRDAYEAIDVHKDNMVILYCA